MNAVLLGISKESLTLAHIIKSAENYPLNGIYIDGIYCKDVSKTASFASLLGISAYTTPEAAIRDADILFISCSDAELCGYSEFLKELSVRNKILCHFSRKYDSSILYCGVTNSVYSISFPYKVYNEKLPLNTPVAVEGLGKHHEIFKTCLQNSLKKVMFRTKEEKMIFSIAHRNITCHIKEIADITKRMYKFADVYSEEDYKLMLTNLIPEILADNTPVAPLEPAEAKKTVKLLNSLNHSDTKDYIVALETHVAENSAPTFREKEELMRILKQKRR